jgi:hypothetical protein
MWQSIAELCCLFYAETGKLEAGHFVFKCEVVIIERIFEE